MNLEKIPIVIQCGITGFLLINSFGITYALIRGSELNVEAINTKLTLTGKINKTKELSNNLRQATEDLKITPASPRTSQKIKKIQQELENTTEELEQLEEEVIEVSVKKDDDQIRETNSDSNESIELSE